MKTIVRALGNIGPFDEIEVLADRLRCYRNGPEDYPFVVIGPYTISDDPDDAPIPMQPVVPVPQSVTMRQAREALILQGVSIASVDAAISAIPDETQRQIAETRWQYATEVRRDDAYVVALGASLSIDLDALFIFAATL